MVRLRQSLLALVLGVTAATAQDAQGWGDLDTLLFSTLTESGTAEASFWLPNAVAPDQATEAVGIVYEAIPGAAGNTGIAIGVYRRAGADFALAGRVEGIYGHMPREVVFHPDRIEFTTTTLNPGDPRCCPTGASRWAIDRATLTARQIH